MSNTWRDIARPIIADVLKNTEGKDEKTIKKALYDAYPFGVRQHHPYRIWLSEVQIQTKGKRFGKKNNVTPKEQMKLF